MKDSLRGLIDLSRSECQSRPVKTFFPFPKPRPALGPNQPPIQLLSGLFPGGKAAGAYS
jgi:hypothetical protein